MDRVKILGIKISHQIHKPCYNMKNIRNIFTASLILITVVTMINFFDFDVLRNAYAATITSGLGDVFEKLENREMYKFLKTKTNDRKIAAYILKYSIKYNIDTMLFLALIKIESRLESEAINFNRDGSIDRGLCQLNSKTFKDVDESLLFDPETNIRLGAEYFNWCMKTAGDNIRIALMYYNAGFGNVANNNVGKITYRYIDRVLYQKNKYDREYKKIFFSI